MAESQICAICNSHSGLQGARVKEKGKKTEPQTVCGLHLTQDGLHMKEGEVTGEWEILNNWGYDGAVQPTPSALGYFDLVMDRILQNSSEGWGWKIVITAGDVTLEASTFPKGGSGSGSAPSPFKRVHVPGGVPDVSGIKWRQNEAQKGKGFFWEFVTNQDGTGKPELAQLLSAIAVAPKGVVTIDGFDYKLGKDPKFINKAKARSG